MEHDLIIYFSLCIIYFIVKCICVFTLYIYKTKLIFKLFLQNLEGEYRLFMIKSVAEKFDQLAEKYWHSFLKYYCGQLGAEFRNFEASLALNLMRFSKFAGKCNKGILYL